MALPRFFLDELHARSDIVELISSYLPLKRQGRLHKALCPFHNEKTASFTVYADTQSFYCFGCGAGGDVITFVMKQDNLEYLEAVRLLAARAGMAVPQDAGDDGMRLRMRLLEANKRAARHYFEVLNSDGGREARVYLRKRGLSDSTIKKFGLGFAPDEWSSLRDCLRGEGFQDGELRAAGLLNEGKRGSYDTFRDRIMFPIIDVRGNIIAFGGRALGDGPKYINSQDTGVFKKSRNLFALNIAKNTTERVILIAEGYMDVIALHQAGFSNTVATLGTALTAAQARILANYADGAVLAYDADEAGQRATTRAIDLLKEVGLAVKVIQLEGAKDPDEYIRKFGSERFRLLLAKSSDSMEYELAKAKLKYPVSSDEGKVRYLAEATSILARSASLTEREVYAGKLAEENGVSKQSVLTQIDYLRSRRRKAREREIERKLSDIPSRFQVPPSRRDAVGAAAAERRLLVLLYKSPDLLESVSGSIEEEDFFSEDARRVFYVLKASIEKDEFSGFSSLSEQLTDSQMSLLSGLVAGSAGVNFTLADADYYVARLKEISNKPDRERLVRMSAEDIQDAITQKRRM